MSIITTEERIYLLNSIKSLLDEYNYNYTEEALNTIIDEWASQKAPLIEAFKKHPNYIKGQFMIAFSKDYEREITDEQAYKFSQWLFEALKGSCRQYVPEDAIDENNGWHWEKPFTTSTYNAIYQIGCYAQRTLDDDFAYYINTANPNIRAKAGEKTTRVINRLCKWLGATNHPDYNREYAKYADSLSPMKVTRHTVLSINPLDYLTMSFGNSWASCHTIDKTNKRGMPNSYEGQYSSGTMSYMLDQPSMVFYTVDASYNGTAFWSQPKITRQMFHYGEEKLVQARLYPQDNDGDDEVYTPSRQLVQEIIACIFEFPNLWKLSRGTSAIRKYVYGCGTHYRDYYTFDSCTLSRHETENEGQFTIGAEPICIECGNTHCTSENINCCAGEHEYYCENCGEGIDGDNVYWVGDYPYCRDCVAYCDYCDEWVLEDHIVYISGYGDVCRDCRDEYLTLCDHCGDHHHNDEMTYVQSTGKDVCDDCLEELYTECDGCGEYFRNSRIAEAPNGYNYCSECYEEHCGEEEIEEA